MEHHLIVLEHGDPRLWPLLGPFAVDRGVHKELGGPILSSEHVTWLFAVDDAGAVLGFCALRDTTSSIWYDYGYVVPACRKRGVFRALAKARDKHAQPDTRPRKTAVREDRLPHYEQRGWAIATRRGRWAYLVKEAP